MDFRRTRAYNQDCKSGQVGGPMKKLILTLALLAVSRPLWAQQAGQFGAGAAAFMAGVILLVRIPEDRCHHTPRPRPR